MNAPSTYLLMLMSSGYHEIITVLNCRIFVGTWNVGGRTPNNTLNLEDFLQVEGSSDLYVLGYDELSCLSACQTFDLLAYLMILFALLSREFLIHAKSWTLSFVMTTHTFRCDFNIE